MVLTCHRNSVLCIAVNLLCYFFSQTKHKKVRIKGKL